MHDYRIDDGQDRWSTKAELNILHIHAGTQQICNSNTLGISNWKVEEDVAEKTTVDIS